MGDFEINSVSWNLSIKQIHTLAYHIGYNKPNYPTSPEHNLLVKEDLVKLLDQLNVILDLDTMHEAIERNWILPHIVKGENMCEGCLYNKTGADELASCKARKQINKCQFYTKTGTNKHAK